MPAAPGVAAKAATDKATALQIYKYRLNRKQKAPDVWCWSRRLKLS